MGSSKNLHDKVTLGTGVFFAFRAIFGGKLTFQGRVICHIFRVMAKMISKYDMPVEFLAVRQTYVEMVWESIGRRSKSLSASNAQIPLMPITKRSQFFDDKRKIGSLFQKNIDVDDRLCRQPRNGRATDMLDGRKDPIQGSGDFQANRGEMARPKRIEVVDGDGIHCDGENPVSLRSLP